MNKRLVSVLFFFSVVIGLGIFFASNGPPVIQSTDYVLSHKELFNEREVVLEGIAEETNETGFVLLAGSQEIPIWISLVNIEGEVETDNRIVVKGILNTTNPLSLIAEEIDAVSPRMKIIFYLRSIIALPPLIALFLKRWKFDFETFSFKRREK
ncbi:MAG: hypothetical protein GF308_03930 [Candidatus Heimdallarchaeota archaeon]|nr:hypothetical protein [Candidatus Heimdallarchaeota archaeon]